MAEEALLLSGYGLRLAQVAWLILTVMIVFLWLWVIRLRAIGGGFWDNSLLDVPYGIIMPLGYFAVATLLVVRKPADGMAIHTSLMLVFLGPYLLTGVNETIGQHPGWELVNRLLVVIGGGLFMLFLFTFPTGRFHSGRVRWLALILMVTYIVGALFTAKLYAGITGTVIPVVLSTGIATQVYRYQRLYSPAQRQQTKWIVAGATSSLLLILYWLLFLRRVRSGRLLNRCFFYLHQSVQAVLGLFLPVALAFSILRYRLWEIDNLINRTLVYGALTACIVAVYALAVGAMSTLFQSQGNWLVALLATGLVAVLFQPLRERWQQWVNQLLYGRRDEPFEVLASLGQRLENTLSPETVFPTIVETVAQALKLPYVALTVNKGEGLETVESIGKLTATADSFPLTYQGCCDRPAFGRAQVAG